MTLVLFVCLFVCLGFSSNWRIFHSYGDVTITGEWQWRFFSLPHRDTGHPFIMVIILGPVTLTPIVCAVEPSLTGFFFYDEVFRGWDSNTQPSARGAYALNHCATAAVVGFKMQSQPHLKWYLDGFLFSTAVANMYDTYSEMWQYLDRDTGHPFLMVIF